MRHIFNRDRWPLHEFDGLRGRAMVAHCRKEHCDIGVFSIDALICPEALETYVTEVVAPVLDAAAFTHSDRRRVLLLRDPGIRVQRCRVLRFLRADGDSG